MGESQKIVDLFRKLQDGDCWIGLNMAQVLKGLSASVAARKPYPKGNSCWMLLNHLIYWRKIVISRLTGETSTPPMPDFYQPADTSDAAWTTAKLHFEQISRELIAKIQQFDAAKLQEASPVKGQTYYALLMGCLQHDSYHIGQIQLLKNLGAALPAA
ncbi:MAG TPA: DinB family protein [Sediminibacterium sp.]|nr:DinB family protein [Sediminibacterium sp.]